MNVVVVRNGPDGTKCENERASTDRERFRITRDIVYARRGLKRYGIGWVQTTNPFTGIRRLTLDAGSVVADARDAGMMSYCCVTVNGTEVRPRFKEQEFAGFGGISICLLRSTQHVLALIEELVVAAQVALEENVA